MLALLLLLACDGAPPAAAQPSPPPAASASSPEPAAAEAWPGVSEDYAWTRTEPGYTPLWSRISTPAGYSRRPVTGYAAWLRALPMAAPGSPVLSYRGDVIWSGDDERLLAVVDLDVGETDLQQCADTILRLRVEHQLHGGAQDIAFHYTSGALSSWPRWAAGSRPTISGSKVSWVKSASPDASRANFERWYRNLFTYAGTLSLAREGTIVPKTDVQGGDFLVMGGSPGHAVTILDTSFNESGEVLVLVGEGYMPAQSLHVLRGPVSGWWPVGEVLDLPTWTGFRWEALRRFNP